MSDDDAGFALPAFDAAAALVQIRRALRELKLVERGAAFELRGREVVRLATEDGALAAQLAFALVGRARFASVVVVERNHGGIRAGFAVEAKSGSGGRRLSSASACAGGSA